MQSAISIDQLTVRVRLGESVARAASLPRSYLSPKESPLASNAGSATTEDAETRELDAAMDRFARGEDASFEQVYRLGATRVHRFLVRMSNDFALADDLTQDTFMRVHAARGGFEIGASARPWLLAIARNTFLDSMRRAKVRRKSADATKAAQRAEPPLAAGETQGDEALVAREMLDIVSVTLAKLSPLIREAFVLVRFEGLTMSEAADVLGTTEAAVKVRAFRAYEALREALGPELEEGARRP